MRAVAVDAEETEADELDEEAAGKQAERALRFSLAGVQLKFSAIKAQGKNGGLTIPVTGSGGDWIVKLPSARHPDVPEAEFAAMKLAAKIGIDVPEIDLVPLDQIDGIPEGITRYGKSAFAIRRFDRGEEGPVHTEDFAQVFGVFADDKYENASYRQILSVLAIETDEQSVVEFVRRLTYSVLIGNGDMHLKNWSLIYPDRRNALLAPAYDLLSTLAYIPGDDAALKFHSSREWASYTYDELEAIADKADTPGKMALVGQLARETGLEEMAVVAGLVAGEHGLTGFERLGYPTVETHPGANWTMVHAIARQESEFDRNRVSHAGARGMMQLMPGTAREVASLLDLPYSKERLFSDPSYNATLGSAYLAGLIKRFGNNPILVSAGYNAGPGRPLRWMRERGDPRTADVDMIDWIEHIPFNETRNYVMRVTESLPVYRARLGKTPLPVPFSKELSGASLAAFAPQSE